MIAVILLHHFCAKIRYREEITHLIVFSEKQVHLAMIQLKESRKFSSFHNEGDGT